MCGAVLLVIDKRGGGGKKEEATHVSKQMQYNRNFVLSDRDSFISYIPKASM